MTRVGADASSRPAAPRKARAAFPQPAPDTLNGVIPTGAVFQAEGGISLTL